MGFIILSGSLGWQHTELSGKLQGRQGTGRCQEVEEAGGTGVGDLSAVGGFGFAQSTRLPRGPCLEPSASCSVPPCGHCKLPCLEMQAPSSGLLVCSEPGRAHTMGSEVGQVGCVGWEWLGAWTQTKPCWSWSQSDPELGEGAGEPSPQRFVQHSHNHRHPLVEVIGSCIPSSCKEDRSGPGGSGSGLGWGHHSTELHAAPWPFSLSSPNLLSSHGFAPLIQSSGVTLQELLLPPRERGYPCP